MSKEKRPPERSIWIVWGGFKAKSLGTGWWQDRCLIYVFLKTEMLRAQFHERAEEIQVLAVNLLLW